jgi:hypothetical protein
MPSCSIQQSDQDRGPKSNSSASLAASWRGPGLHASCKGGRQRCTHVPRERVWPRGSAPAGSEVPFGGAVPAPRSPRGLRGRRPDRHRWPQAAARARAPAPTGEHDGADRSPRRCCLGRGAARDSSGDPADVRFQASRTARIGTHQWSAPRLPIQRRARGARHLAVRDTPQGSPRGRLRTEGHARRSQRGPRALAGSGSCRPRRRAVTVGGDRPARGAQTPSNGREVWRPGPVGRGVGEAPFARSMFQPTTPIRLQRVSPSAQMEGSSQVSRQTRCSFGRSPRVASSSTSRHTQVSPGP